jgi:predicted transcriptional regulator
MLSSVPATLHSDQTVIQREPRHRLYTTVPDALITDHRVSHLAVRVWIHLATAAESGADPTAAAAAASLGVSKGGVARAILNLSRTGWITRQRTAGGSWTTKLHEASTVPVEAQS